MGLSLFLIPWSNQRQTILLAKRCIANQSILTSSCSGIVIIIFLPITVSLVHLPIGPKTVCTTLGLLNEELQHLKEALVRCKYPRWVINKVQNKVINDNWEDSGNTHVGNTSQDTITSSGNSQTSATSRRRPSMGHIVIPHVQGLRESIKCN